MLIQRVLTAGALLLLLVPALLVDAVQPFAALALLTVAAAGWEWGRLSGLDAQSAVMVGVGIAVLAAMTWAAGWATAAPPPAWWLISAVWVLGGSRVLQRGPAGWSALPRSARLGVGLVLLWAAWMALAAAKARGPNFILSVFCLVWVADIAAYFGGRTWGRRKLAPSISPGKSWEGVFSGFVGVALLAAGWTAAERAWLPTDASLYSLLLERLGLAGLAIGLVFLASLSVVGDLFESLIKRAAGAKDSSGLLPGHGGVLDRIDALLPVFPVALALATL